MTARLSPYLMMGGNAKEAIQFYENALEAKVLNTVTYGEMGGAPEELKDYVAHAAMKIGESDLMISDSPEQPPQQGNQVTICITVKDAAKAKQFFEALQQDGQVHHPLKETPFSPAFGNVTDQFGITFQIVADRQ